MKESIARRTVAAYLTGVPVSQTALRQAWEVAGRDAGFREVLEEELALGADWSSDCEVFRANLAEFAELDSGQRQQEMPELVFHLNECPACRKAYSETVPLWSAAEATVQSGGDALWLRRLAEAIALGIGEGGVLRKGASGPLPVDYAPVTAAAGPAALLPRADEAPVQQQDWFLDDEQAGWSIRLSAQGLPSGQLGLTVTMLSLAGQQPFPEYARVEIRELATGAVFFSDRLEQAGSERITLKPGQWLIVVQGRFAEFERRWDIPLKLEPPGADSWK
jgi:hypothetical protein